jgi:hypothetical protein
VAGISETDRWVWPSLASDSTHRRRTEPPPLGLLPPRLCPTWHTTGLLSNVSYYIGTGVPSSSLRPAVLLASVLEDPSWPLTSSIKFMPCYPSHGHHSPNIDIDASQPATYRPTLLTGREMAHRYCLVVNHRLCAYVAEWVRGHQRSGFVRGQAGILSERVGCTLLWIEQSWFLILHVVVLHNIFLSECSVRGLCPTLYWQSVCVVGVGTLPLNIHIYNLWYLSKLT